MTTTNLLKELLVGILLGDASIRRVGTTKAVISFAQSGKKEAYFDHVYNTLQGENLLLNPRNLRSFVDPRYPTKTNTALSFSSKSSEELKPLADLFLNEEGKKIVPYNISELLTPRSLAYWIMDDGQQVKRGGVTLCTDNFKHEEILMLQDALKSKFDLKTTIHIKKGILNTYERIYISKNSVFESLKPSIVKHMEDSMKYKLNIEKDPSLPLQVNIPTEKLSPEISSPVNTKAEYLAPGLVSETEGINIDKIIGESIDTVDSFSTLNILTELLLECI